ncbi:MAG: helix-turn-helix domain-containing protein [Saprospiraceae bacterium]|nr:helix-turn-helix domain-containing protein [Saprospiraceae bacterium]
MAVNQLQRIILGLKVRQFRQERGCNFDELSKQTGISISYLNEIEKGKKYPKTDNRHALANALGISESFLTSAELTKQFAPLGELLKSNFLRDLPLDLFGIEIQQIVEIIARDPDRVNAFISAILEISRAYSLREENFYFAALRAYQELRSNYFEEIEIEAERFVKENGLPTDGGVPYFKLANLLEKKYGCQIIHDGLSEYPELQGVRSVYNPGKKRLLLNGRLNDKQRAFQLAKELGFNALGLKERPLASTFLKVSSFEEVLNNYKAAYFAVAILINQESFATDVGHFFAQSTWQGDALLALIEKYQASPEVFFQRFNVVTKAFGLDKVFFLRFIHDLETDLFEIDKELHINRRHQPHATGINEHYCRRWLSPVLLRELQTKAGKDTLLAGAHRATFMNSGDEYLCMALAKPGYPTVNKHVSIMLGVLLDDHTKKIIRFWNDPTVVQTTVNITCERCPLENCQERAAEATVVQRREKRKKMQELIGILSGTMPSP